MVGVFERFGKVVRQDTALFVQSPGDDEVVGTGDPLQVTHIALQLSDIQLENTDILLKDGNVLLEFSDPFERSCLSATSSLRPDVLLEFAKPCRSSANPSSILEISCSSKGFNSEISFVIRPVFHLQ